ncbi:MULTISPECIES: TonB-dependent receptor [unclassified Sphingomonas]|uniref:TonB-dependent receptor n=1 Tax=unclassified Sphingomonas TaxID=196159 RepID=UPI002150E2B6|nr:MULTISPECIES: TonB-dependent receptor [unclassified Sphingomonas]MCR5869723.1 TonB-dependent receptor [Sphingomonas sp. J344]UUX98571.1 TonB-dependent receptor [Sphingomonas sp. J315]
MGRGTSRAQGRAASSIAAIAAFLSFTAAAPALAQDAAEEASSAASDEIVVTARRREESLQDTPVAISAFSAETLQERQITQTQDLERITPSLQFKPAGQLSGNSASSVVFIRGVGQVDPTAAVDPGVGVYLDEVYLGRAVGGAIDFGDIAGVEVLRGPQGTLFGRNTIGGAILVRTQQPKLGEFSGRARVRGGSENLIEGFGVVNVPLGSTVAARVSGGFRKRDGYVIRAVDGLDLGNENRFSLAASLLWEPSSDFDLFVRADYSKQDENGAPFTFAGINEQAPVAAIASVAAGCPGATIPFAPLVPGDPRFGAPNVPMINDIRCANDLQARGPYVNGGTAPVESNSEVWGIGATANIRLTDVASVKLITSYRETESRGIRDGDNTPLLLITTDVAAQSAQFSQEVQLQLDFGSVNAIIGGYYFNEVTDERATVPLAFPPSPPVIGSLLAGGPGSRDLQLSRLKTDSVAAFGELAWNVTDALEISGGLRYTSDRKHYRGTVLNLFPATLPDPNPLPTLATSQGGTLFIFNRPFMQDFSALTGSASIQYRWNDAISTYASYAKSFKSGGYNTRYNAAPAGNLPVPFAEESVTSYEIGAKTNIGRLRLNLAAFQAEYQDIQLIFRQGVVPLLFNAGEARIRGLEAEASLRTSWGLTFDAGISLLDDQIKSITPVPGATATVTPNDDLPFTPDVQANFGIAYAIPLGGDMTLTPRVDGSYQSKITFITGSIPLIEEDGYFVGNASLTLKLGNGIEVSGGVNNLLDERYLIQGNASLATLGYAERIFARPRSWYVQVAASF